MKVRVTKQGISQREGDVFVDRAIGEIIDVSEAAYAHVGPAGRGMVELVDDSSDTVVPLSAFDAPSSDADGDEDMGD